jgi:hypothetical protein
MGRRLDSEPGRVNAAGRGSLNACVGRDRFDAIPPDDVVRLR